MESTLKDYTPEDLSKVVTHIEACEMFLDIAANSNDMDKQVKRLITHATSLELEIEALKSQLEKDQKFKDIL